VKRNLIKRFLLFEVNEEKRETFGLNWGGGGGGREVASPKFN